MDAVRRSVVIAAHDERRLALLERAVRSVLAQPGSVELIVAVDNNPALFQTVGGLFPEVRTVLNEGPRGASSTRNTGARAATGTVLAFLDDDAEAHEGWLDALTRPLDDDAVVGVGGWIVPDWSAGKPRWFPDEFGWVVGASYTGLPTRPGPVRNVWSENMAVRAEDFWAVGGFREGFGKVGDSSRPEDTELCLRMAESRRGSTWWLAPDAVVAHHVPHERSTAGFYWRRCRAEGVGKAALRRLPSGTQALATEQAYVREVLPRGVAGGLTGIVRGDAAGPLRALAILIGLLAAALGFGAEIIRPGGRS